MALIWLKPSLRSYYKYGSTHLTYWYNPAQSITDLLFRVHTISSPLFGSTLTAVPIITLSEIFPLCQFFQSHPKDQLISPRSFHLNCDILCIATNLTFAGLNLSFILSHLSNTLIRSRQAWLTYQFFASLTNVIRNCITDCSSVSPRNMQTVLKSSTNTSASSSGYH